jgi:hypothetical protein
LGESTKFGDNIIYIDGMKFSMAMKAMQAAGYTRYTASPEGLRYPHHSIQGLALIVNKEQKTIVAEAWGESALSQIYNDLNLPAYSSG